MVCYELVDEFHIGCEGLGPTPHLQVAGWASFVAAVGTSSFSSSAGTLTITSSLSTRLAGSFQFTAERGTVGNPEVVQIQGTFDAITYEGGADRRPRRPAAGRPMLSHDGKRGRPVIPAAPACQVPVGVTRK